MGQKFVGIVRLLTEQGRVVKGSGPIYWTSMTCKLSFYLNFHNSGLLNLNLIFFYIPYFNISRRIPNFTPPEPFLF